MLTLLLLFLALLPPVIFLLRLIRADANEPEPFDMILFAIGLGVISTFPASLVEWLLDFIPIFGMDGFLGAAVKSFVQVAPAEEGCKLAVILLFVWRNRNFNEENDGIVYVTASAIGFAMLENILYVFDGEALTGVMTSFARSLTSIPLHTFCGVIMGYYVGRARFAAGRADANRLILTGFLIAWFIHGLYDTFAIANSSVNGSATLLVPLVIALFLVGNGLIKKGRARSLERWNGSEYSEKMTLDTPAQNAARLIAKYGEGKIGVDESGKYFLKPERQTWKAVTGWILLIGSMVTCGIIMALLGGYDGEEATIVFVNLSFMTTAVPITLGIILLVSYRRRLDGNHYF
jgi:protease PrsW